ncbi:MAG TPA: hypothetical protein VFT72_08860 [Opitutaceae bacterium]|nr:hypothetical protein [Opitutaceae bacterium]
MQFERIPRLAALAFIALSSVATVAVAQPEASGPTYEDAYIQAVASYVSAAQKETKAVRDEVTSNEKLGKRALYAPVRAQVEKCEQLVARLRTAGPSQFDALKQSYEKARAELLEKLAAARKG